MSQSAQPNDQVKPDNSTKLLAGAVIGIAVGLVGLFMGLQSGDKAPFLGWLWGCAFWLSIAIGMLMLVMIFRVFNSRWTPVVRRQQDSPGARPSRRQGCSPNASG